MPTVSLEIDTPEWAVPLLEPARYKGAVGGRARGASHFFAGLAVEEMVCDPDLHFVCIREVQRALRYSAKSLVEAKIRAHGVAELFDIKSAEIRRRGGTGVMIFEGMQDHTADSIKSLEDFRRCWVEEAHALSDRSLRLLRPTIRAPGSELWFSWNRDSPEDAVDRFFASRVSDPRVVLAEATYLDNPFLPSEMLQEAEHDRAADPGLYEHVWLGGYFLGGSGRVYSSYSDRPYPDGNLDESVTDKGGVLLVGIDFNVNPMSAVIAQRAVDECEVLASLQIKTSNTEELVAEMRSRYPGRTLIACPDPSGNSRKTSAPVGQTDFTILRHAGFQVRAPKAAPPVVDRVNNANAMYHERTTGRRRVRVHPDAAALRTGLKNQTYKEGTNQPDKKSGYDHICEALDYLLWQEFNVLAQKNIPVLQTVAY